MGLFSSAISAQDGVLYICGGVKMNAQQNHFDHHFNRLHALNISDLQSIDLESLPNSTQSCDWKRAPLRNLPIAELLCKGVHVFDVDRAQPVFAKHKSNARRLSIEDLKREPPFRTVDSGKSRKLKELALSTSRFYLKTVPNDDSFITVLDVSQVGDKARQVRYQVQQYEISTQTTRQTHEVFLDVPRIPGLTFRPDMSCNWHSALPLLCENKIFQFAGNRKRVQSLDLSTGEVSEVDDWNNFDAEFNGQLNGSKYYVVQNPINFAQLQFGRGKLEDSCIRQFDFLTEETKEFSPPTGYQFTGNFCFDNFNYMYVIVLPTPAADDAPNANSNHSGPAIFRFNLENGASQLIVKPNAKMFATARTGGMTVDEQFVYFVGALSKELWSFERGDRTGNAAIYRVELPSNDGE